MEKNQMASIDKKYTILLPLLLTACISQVSYSLDAVKLDESARISSPSEMSEEFPMNEYQTSLMSSLNKIASEHASNGITVGEAVAIAISIISLLFTCTSTYIMYKQITAETIRNYLEKYSSKEMLDALRDIDSVDVDAWGKKKLGEEEYNRIDQSRRHVKYFYHQAYLLWKSKAITKNCFKVICGLRGVDLYIKKIRNMERYLNTDHPEDSFDFYENFCQSHKINTEVVKPLQGKNGEAGQSISISPDTVD